MISLINKAFSEYGPYTLLFIISLFSLIQILVQLFFSNIASKQLEVYKITMGGNLNRKTRFIEKEYVALSECWSSFIKVYDIIKRADVKYNSRYDFNGMDDEKIERFLRECNFLDDQINEMKISPNKGDLFTRINKKNFHANCEDLLEKFKDTLFANEIFMEEEIFKKFYHFLDMFRGVLWGLLSRDMSKEISAVQEAQNLIYLPLKPKTIQEKNELLLLVKESLQKDDSTRDQKKLCQHIASFCGRIKEKVKARK